MNKEDYLEQKYIKTKNKIRKIITYKEGDNKLRMRHEEINQFLANNCNMSIFAKAYVENSSVVKNARAHMYNDFFVFFDVKNFFPNINHNYLARQLYKELNKKNSVSLNSCSRLVRMCSIGDRGLPLGLITSPILSNIYLKEFDNVLYGKLKKLGLKNIIYTRYADDIVISYQKENTSIEDKDKIKEIVYNELKRVGLKSNGRKEKFIIIEKSGHVKVTGINIIRDENNYRSLSIGRKKKDKLYNRAVEYIKKDKQEQQEALEIKGYESFVLAVEGVKYENCYSEKMKQYLKELGYCSLHELIKDIKYEPNEK